MATAITIINRALRLCKVLDPVETAEAEDADVALEVLNALLAEWYEAGIGLPDYSVATLATEVSSDAADREAIAYQLAARLAPEYGVDLSPLVAAAGESSMGRLRLRYFQPGSVSSAELPGESSVYNINTD